MADDIIRSVVNTGDRDEAIEALFFGLYQRVARTAFALVGDWDVAEQIAQEAFLRLWRRWPWLRDQQAAPAYLQRTVVNLARLSLRRLAAERRALERYAGERALARVDDGGDLAADLALRRAVEALRYPELPADTDVAWRRFIRLRRQAAIQRRVIAAGAAVAVVTAATVAAAFARQGNGAEPSGGRHVNRPAHIGRLAITARIAVPGAGGAPGDKGMAGVVAGQGGQVWAITYSDRLIRIDPATNRVTLHTHVAGLTDMTSGAGAIWLLTTAGVHGELLRIEPATGHVLATLPLPRPCSQVSYADGQLWLACATGRASVFLRLDPATGRVLARGGPAHGVYSIAATGDGIWYSGDSGVSGFVGSGARLRWVNASDPAGLSNSDSLIFSGGAVWAFDGGESVARIDPRTGRIIRIYNSAAYDPSGSAGLDFFAVGRGSLWFLDDGRAATTSVLRVSLTSGEPQGQASSVGSCGEPCWQIYLAGGSVWVPTRTYITRIEPARRQR